MMRYPGHRGRWIALAALAGLAVSAANALTEPLGDALRRCGQESDAGKRLACFDALVGSLPKMKADQFGMTAAIAEKRDPGVTARAQAEMLDGTIKDLRQNAQGEWIFTLDNGQVWVQSEPRTNLTFAVGESVHIEHGAMGTLWLAASKARKTKVKRLS